MASGEGRICEGVLSNELPNEGETYWSATDGIWAWSSYVLSLMLGRFNIYHIIIKFISGCCSLRESRVHPVPTYPLL